MDVYPPTSGSSVPMSFLQLQAIEYSTIYSDQVTATNMQNDVQVKHGTVRCMINKNTYFR